MPRIAAPKNDTGKPADHISVIAAGAISSNNLLTISRRPQHAPQKLVAVNTNTTTVQTLVFRGEDDSADTTVSIPFNDSLEINTPVKSLTSGGADIEVHCYWWAGATVDYNK